MLSYKITWRRHPDLNWGSGCCRPTPYHLAIALLILEFRQNSFGKLTWNLKSEISTWPYKCSPILSKLEYVYSASLLTFFRHFCLLYARSFSFLSGKLGYYRISRNKSTDFGKINITMISAIFREVLCDLCLAVKAPQLPLYAANS